MLVLTRKYQEKICIGNDITITVLRTKGKAVRLGIEAPATVPVIRGELKFEQQDGAPETLSADGDAAAGRNGTRTRESFSEPTWTTASRPEAPRRHNRAAVEVGHRRVPREKVTEILPQLVSGTGTLRAMLDQRSATA